MNQRRAVASLRELNSAERRYSAQRPDATYACALNDLEQFGIDRVLLSGDKAGYRFEVSCPPSEQPREAHYLV